MPWGTREESGQDSLGLRVGRIHVWNASPRDAHADLELLRIEDATRSPMRMNPLTTQLRENPPLDSSLPGNEAWINRRARDQATRAANARQISGRRRFVDPTTCERDYSQAEMEFMLAMNEYKQKSGRMFPTWSEVLEVLRALGYEKIIPMGDPDTAMGSDAARQCPANRPQPVRLV